MLEKAMQSMTRKELKVAIDKTFESAKNLKSPMKPTSNKLNFKEMFAQLDEGKSIEEVVGPFPKTGTIQAFPGEQRYDDQINVSSDFNYPVGLLQIVGGNKELVESFNEMDQEIATFRSDVYAQIDEKILKGLQFKGEKTELDWDNMMRISPSFMRPLVEQMKLAHESVTEVPDNYDQLLLSFEKENEEILEVLEKDDKFIDERIASIDRELQRTKDFYDKLPTLTIHQFCEMEPELYELAVNELDRKVNTVGWDPIIELTPEQIEMEEHVKRVLGLRSIPELPN